MTTYTNPRKLAVIDNWPAGKHTVKAQFYIEHHPKRGERAVRITFNFPNSPGSQPKKLTYAPRVRIVDGDDGRTYLAHDQGWSIMIYRGTMDYEHERVTDSEPRFFELQKLFEGR